MINLAKSVLASAMMKADEAEVYLSRTKELTIEIYDSSVETLKEAESKGLGIRVFIGHNVGFAFTSDLSAESIEKTVDMALQNTSFTHGDEYMGVAEKSNIAYPEISFDEALEHIPLEKKIDLALLAEESAKKFDDRITKIESCGYEDVISEEVILNSKGIEVISKANYCGLYVSLLAVENGDTQTGFAIDFKRNFEQIDAERCGKEAAQKAVELLGARTIHTQNLPLIFDPYTTTNLLGVMASSFSAENVLKGKSILKGKLNQQIMSESISIIDDGAMPDGIMSASADAEGLPTRTNILVEKGILKTFLHNHYTAKRAQTQSTGNATRSGYAGTVGVGTTNLYIAGGSRTENEMIKSVDRGLYVTSLLGVHTANPITGDFSIGASGRLIESGEKTIPVRGVVISGNLLSMFRDIQEVGNNVTFFAGKGAPSIRTGNITVSGD